MIRADARLYGASLNAGTTIEHQIADSAHVYLVGSVGQIRVNGEIVGARDSLAIRDVASLQIEAVDNAEFVFVEAWESLN